MRRGAVVLLVLLAACATQRYGRVQAVGANERAALTCEQVDVEIGKTADFLNQTFAQKDPVSGADVLGWLGDLGIGNDLEYEAALKSGTQRCGDLVKLRTVKQCSAAAPIVDTSKGDLKVQRALKACIPIQ